MTTSERLVDKAKEAFVMAIEIYNKPSINYRLEGFSFFICNAWELMLKAHMQASGKVKEFVMPNTDKTAVEIEWLLDVPVREDLYEYIVNE